MFKKPPSVVLPFLGRGENRTEGADVLAELKAALEGAAAMPENEAAPPGESSSGAQQVEGDWNLQISEEPVLSQVIKGNNNIQISGAQVLLRVNIRARR